MATSFFKFLHAILGTPICIAYNRENVSLTDLSNSPFVVCDCKQEIF